MFALRGQGRRKAAARSAPAVDGIVLPRPLRRPARILRRLTENDFSPPRFSAAILTVTLFAAAGLYGTVAGGYTPAIVQAITARTGFAVDEVKVSGHRETSEIDVIGQLGLDGYTSLIGFDVDAARDAVAQLPWVETASVRKIYPDALEVRISEREPFAIWQHGRELTLIEASGEVIAPFAGSRYAALPLVIGLGAPEKAFAFVARVEKFPELASRVRAYIHVGERRWDLKLENGVTIKLPENGADEAIATLLQLDEGQGILSRDIAAIDMRLNDRLTVRLTPEAVVRRNAAVQEQMKAAAKAERAI